MKSVKSAVRLEPNLIHEAEIEALIHKRTTPKQIEYWAEIGRKVSQQVDPIDLIAVTQGIALLKVEQRSSYLLDADVIFSQVEDERLAGYLSDKLTKANVSYEADSLKSGMLVRINADGSKDIGQFRNGKFIKLKPSNAE